MSKRKRYPHRISPSQAVMNALQKSIIPWAEGGELLLMSSHVPLQGPNAVRVTPLRTALLKNREQKRSKGSPLPSHLSAHWARERLLAQSNTHLACVLEGCADLQIGVTETMAALSPEIDPAHGRYVLRLPQRSFLLLPPHIPYSDWTRPHWDESNNDAELAHHSQILWLNILPEGAMAHICQTAGANHYAAPRTFILDPQLIHITDLLQLQMAEKDGAASKISLLLLQALLLRVEAAFKAQRITADKSKQTVVSTGRRGPTRDNSVSSQDAVTTDASIERACIYIAAHLTQPLTTAQIANCAYASVSHLNRLFRSQLNTTVLKYVTARRIEAAMALLRNTDLPVTAVAQHLGFRHVAHFSQVFTHNTGVTPSAYRASHRAANQHTSDAN